MLRWAVLAWVVTGSAHAVEVELEPGADIRTLTSAIEPGDQFIFGDGEYVLDDTWVVQAEGTEDKKVVFRAAENAEPIIRLTTAGSRVLLLRNSSHVEVRGLRFTMDDERYEAGGNGIRIDNSSDITVENGWIRHTGNSSIALGGDNARITVRDMELSDTRAGYGIYAGCWDAACWTQESTFEHLLIHDLKNVEENLRYDGIHIAPGGQGNTIRENVIFDVNRIGIITYSTEAGPQNIIENNVVWGSGGSGLWIGGAALVRNNVVFQTGQYGLYTENHRDKLENLVVAFNTFVDTGSAAVRIEDWAGRRGMVFANNLLVNPVGQATDITDDDIDEGVYISTNVASGLVTGLDPELGHFVVGGAYTDFEDFTNWDFYPAGNAVGRSNGDGSAEAYVPTIDFNGFERNGENPTVGAYEYVGNGNPGWLIAEDFKVFEDRRFDPTAKTGCCKKETGSVEASFVALPLMLGGALWRRRRRRGNYAD